MFEKEAPRDVHAFSSEIVGRIDTNTRRIRTLEQRLEGVELRVGSLEEKIIYEVENLRKGLEQISMDVKALGDNLLQIRTELMKVNKTLDNTAKKAEVKELESLLDIYNPIKSKFVTKDEVQRIMDERLGGKT